MTSEPILPPAARPGQDGTRRRYRSAIIANARAHRYPALLARVADTADLVIDNGQGLLTIGGRTADLPPEMCLAVATFRLGEYLSLRFASDEVAWRMALHAEPLSNLSADDFHVVTFDTRTGRILGYVCLATNGDTEPRSLGMDRQAARFPVELAHDLDVFVAVGSPATHSGHVREIKRFVHCGELTDPPLRLRITVDLMQGLAQSLLGQCSDTRVVIGDLEAATALRHLLLMGLEVHLIEGTRPDLGSEDLMGPLYLTREVVEPFHAELPPVQVLEAIVANLAAIGRDEQVIQAASGSLRVSNGTVRRHRVEAPTPVSA